MEQEGLMAVTCDRVRFIGNRVKKYLSEAVFGCKADPDPLSVANYIKERIKNTEGLSDKIRVRYFKSDLKEITIIDKDRFYYITFSSSCSCVLQLEDCVCGYHFGRFVES